MIALLWFRLAGSTISVSLLFAGLNVWPFHATLHTFCGTFRSSLSFPLKWAKGFSCIYFSIGLCAAAIAKYLRHRFVCNYTHIYIRPVVVVIVVAVVRHRLSSCIINARRLWLSGPTLPLFGNKLNCK